ncbi:hypothetical protein AB0C77_03825 [Streptomyces sp. NPDC048629]|uniref:hypothetical protein n=1 Tax=Streptomyces sp. NPDC048629 TaxID=3154824 RepID=UPI003433CFB6
MLSEDLWERLNPPRFKTRAYEEDELPCPLDADIDSALAALTGQRQFETLARFTARHAVGMFGMYAVRMASLAVRVKEPEPLRRGMLAHCLAHYSCSGKFYWTPPGPYLIHRACRILELDPAEYFTDIPEMVPAYTRNAVAELLPPDGEEPDLGALLYVEGEDSGGFRFLKQPFTVDWSQMGLAEGD